MLQYAVSSMVQWVEYSLSYALKYRDLASVYEAPYEIVNKFIVSDIPHVQWKVVRLE